jgi:hypothetical protein
MAASGCDDVRAGTVSSRVNARTEACRTYDGAPLQTPEQRDGLRNVFRAIDRRCNRS